MQASDYVRIPKCHEGKQNARPNPRAVVLTRDTAVTSDGLGLSKLLTPVHSGQYSKYKRLLVEQANRGNALLCSCCS